MRFGRRALLDQLSHGDAEGLGAANLWVRVHLDERACRELDGGIRPHLPVRDEERPGTRIEESLRHARHRFGGLAAGAGGIASRQYHPVGIKLEGGNLRSGEKAVVALERFRITCAL